MGYYKIYAGLSGGFGGANYIDTLEFENEDAANDYAFESACELYYSYGGYHGLFNRKNALEEDPYLTDDELTEMEDEDRENWIDYYVIETNSLDDSDED